MPSFYLFFLNIYGCFFCSDIGLFSPCRRHLTLYLQEMASDLSLFYDCFLCSNTGLFSPYRRHLCSTCREWHLTFLLCYHVQCLTHTSLTPVLREPRRMVRSYVHTRRAYLSGFSSAQAPHRIGLLDATMTSGFRIQCKPSQQHFVRATSATVWLFTYLCHLFIRFP